MIKYKLRAWLDAKIETVEISRETDKFIQIKGRIGQTAKTSTGEWYRDTPKEVKQCLVDYRIEELRIARQRIKYAEEDRESAYKRIREAEALELPEPEEERKRV